MLAKFGELSIGLYALSSLWVSNTSWLIYLPLGWLVKQPRFPDTLPNEDLIPSTNRQPLWQTSWGLSHWETYDTTSRIKFDDIKEVFHATEWDSSRLSRKILDYLHLKDFLQYQCELELKQPSTPPRCKIIVAYCTLHHRLATEIGRRSIIATLEIIDYLTFALIVQLKTRHTLCWSVHV